jgi:hypothetical protein
LVSSLVWSGLVSGLGLWSGSLVWVSGLVSVLAFGLVSGHVSVLVSGLFSGLFSCLVSGLVSGQVSVMVSGSFLVNFRVLACLILTGLTWFGLVRNGSFRPGQKQVIKIFAYCILEHLSFPTEWLFLIQASRAKFQHAVLGNQALK